MLPTDGGALGIGNIIALDAIGRFVKPQRLLQFGQGFALAVGIRLPLGAQGTAGFPRHFQQPFAPVPAAVPRLGTTQLHLLPAAAGIQPLLDDLRLLDLVGQQDLRRHWGSLSIELLDELA